MSNILYLRDLLTEEMTPRCLQLPRSATHDHFSIPPLYPSQKSSVSTPGRNRPHSLHVKPVYGVSGSTVCAVQEPVFPRRVMSPLSDRDFTSKLAPELSTRYSANRTKSEAAVGIIPVTYEWKNSMRTNKLLSPTPLPLEIAPSEPPQPQIVAFERQKETTNDDRLKKQQILVQVLNKAGNSGIKREKLPTLFAYLARNKNSLNNSNILSPSKNPTSEKHTSIRKQGLPKINRQNQLRFSKHAVPHY